jgi:hypothetical protein
MWSNLQFFESFAVSVQKKIRRTDPANPQQFQFQFAGQPASTLATPIHAVLLAEPSEIWGHLQPGQRFLRLQFIAGVSPKSHQLPIKYQISTAI